MREQTSTRAHRPRARTFAEYHGEFLPEPGAEFVRCYVAWLASAPERQRFACDAEYVAAMTLHVAREPQRP